MESKASRAVPVEKKNLNSSSSTFLLISAREITGKIRSILEECQHHPTSISLEASGKSWKIKAKNINNILSTSKTTSESPNVSAQFENLFRVPAFKIKTNFSKEIFSLPCFSIFNTKVTIRIFSYSSKLKMNSNRSQQFLREFLNKWEYT